MEKLSVCQDAWNLIHPQSWLIREELLPARSLYPVVIFLVRQKIQQINQPTLMKNNLQQWRLWKLYKRASIRVIFDIDPLCRHPISSEWSCQSSRSFMFLLKQHHLSSTRREVSTGSEGLLVETQFPLGVSHSVLTAWPEHDVLWAGWDVMTQQRASFMVAMALDSDQWWEQTYKRAAPLHLHSVSPPNLPKCNPSISWCQDNVTWIWRSPVNCICKWEW